MAKIQEALEDRHSISTLAQIQQALEGRTFVMTLAHQDLSPHHSMRSAFVLQSASITCNIRRRRFRALTPLVFLKSDVLFVSVKHCDRRTQDPMNYLASRVHVR